LFAVKNLLFIWGAMLGNLLIVEQHPKQAKEIYQDIFNLFDKYHIATSEHEANIILIGEEFDRIISELKKRIHQRFYVYH
jgi:hypothetical protein